MRGERLIKLNWLSLKDDRDAAGLLTPLALALDAIEDNGCDCGTDEPGTCLACRCEAALRYLWECYEAVTDAQEKGRAK